MNAILSKIQQSDGDELSLIIAAVIERYKAVFPDWEVMFLSLPRNDSDDCIRELELIMEFVRNHCK